MFSPERNNNLISVLHVKPDIDDELLSYSSFGWQEFPQDLKHVEKRGKAYIVYPHGFTLDVLDQILGEDSHETISDLEIFSLKAFTFKKELRDTSDENLRTIGNHFREKNLKLFKKKRDITYVGVHHRRGDHIAYQKEKNMSPLEPGYFLEAMDMYRDKYKRRGSR